MRALTGALLRFASLPPQALRDAGLIEPPAAVSSASKAVGGAPAPSPPPPGAGWKLRAEHREETGVIFATSFPALDSLVEELARAMSARLDESRAQARQEWLEELRAMLTRRRMEDEAAAADEVGASNARAGCMAELCDWLAEQARETATAAPGASPAYEFNRKLLFKLLVMANSQLAEIVQVSRTPPAAARAAPWSRHARVPAQALTSTRAMTLVRPQARGPNLQINAACAGTTAAMSLGVDWLRTGRCRRVVVISADNPSSDHLLPWVGIGFLALGAACTKPKVEEAALPFDKRRSGMLLGAGAVGLVLETDAAAFRPGRPPLASILGVRHANSAYHASAIGVQHATAQLGLLLQEVEVVHGLSRHEIASSLLYVSHETFTCARNGGCAGAEVTALRAAFGEDVRKVLITNSKGMTGHAMGVCFEDAVAVAALSTGLAPPVVHHREADPVLGSLRLSDGAAHDCRYALHFAAGFGSQITYILYQK